MLKFFVLFASIPLIASEEHPEKYFISPCFDRNEKIPWQNAISVGFRNYILDSIKLWSPVNYNCWFEEDLKKILERSRTPVVFRFQIRNGPKLHSDDVTRTVFEKLKDMKNQESYPRDPILSELEKARIGTINVGCLLKKEIAYEVEVYSGSCKVEVKDIRDTTNE